MSGQLKRVERLEAADAPRGVVVTRLLPGESMDDGWRRLHGDRSPSPAEICVFLTTFGDDHAVP